MSSKGFSIVEVIIVVIVVALVGALGWVFYSNQIVGDNTTTSSGTVAETSLPQVESQDDLQSAEDAIKAIDVDRAIDTSDLEASLE